MHNTLVYQPHGPTLNYAISPNFFLISVLFILIIAQLDTKYPKQIKQFEIKDQFRTRHLKNQKNLTDLSLTVILKSKAERNSYTCKAS
jgi:hypothetical protein